MPFSAPGSKSRQPLVAVRIEPFQSEWFDPINSAAYVPRIFRGRKTRGVIRLPVPPRSKSFEIFRNHRFGNRGADNGPTIVKLRYPLATVALLGTVKSVGLINKFDSGGVG